MVPRETEGRRGKQESGKAKTREAKIGCVFTQTNLDEAGFPIRDEDDYLCWCHRGSRGLRQAHLCRGNSTRSWTGREGHCLGRRSTLDLGNCGAALSLRHSDCGSLSCPRAFGQSGQSRLWAHQCPSQTMGSGLLATTHAGEVEAVIRSLKRIRTREHQARKEIRKAIHYFQTNAPRCATQSFVARSVCRLWRCRSRLQDGDRPTAEAIWNALDRRRSQRHYRPTLLSTQQSLGRILGTSFRQLSPGPLRTPMPIGRPLRSTHPQATSRPGVVM